ncbi:Asp23/Gls24 family envelope stress response protein [Gracilibacillus caseinilyticus]|uniref:Asp23/Gls24 family envelope stress response protein n=1 Tax=Gracilibacillus caseinilyticus TaxID=2932256 RepID=A0ABY4EST1_9BACI|nr:Asp23/Gls24 family envelope stress response protein [Gracilibacillus caseinilyticus]UOQ47485.1 Asp23/Gls24 family envelope stress response protein [Gracilibacillus caseinilyticus]
MSDNQLLNVGESTPLGKVEISPDVLEVIAGIATTEVPGVSSMRGNFATGVAERLGKKTHGKGIKVELKDEMVLIDVFIVVDYGHTIPTVAQQIQSNVRQAIKNMTAIQIKEINIHVVGVHMEQMNEDLEI